MAVQPIISIIGRPNVGKSSLFNRIIGKRLAVVDDMPGVTRDRNYHTTEWNGEAIVLVDTGGMLPSDTSAIPRAIHEQVRIAINESAAVLFLVDATTGPTDIDVHIAQIIKRLSPEKVLCVANKAEADHALYETDAFRSLGLGTVYPVSAQHGSGVADVLDAAVRLIRASRVRIAAISDDTNNTVRIAVIGRPNAGKSSLVNTLLRKNRMIVDDKPGTTRDAIDSIITRNKKRIVLIDTAGLRKKSHVKHDMEYYANLRAIESIDRCDVCVLMIDVTGGIGVQDMRILKKIFDQRKGVIIALNKWDALPKDHKTFDQFTAQSRREYKELQHVPMVAISALTGQRAISVIDMALSVKERLTARVSPAQFEDTLFSWVRVHPHPAIPEDPVRFLGAKQSSASFPLFRIFTTNPKGIAPSFHRYLINKIHETYDFDGCPVVVEYRPARRAKRRSVHSQDHNDGGTDPL